MTGVTIFDHSSIKMPLGILAGVNAAQTTALEGVDRDDTSLKALRVSKGLGRYSGLTYTVPSLPLPVPGPEIGGGALAIVMNDTTTPPAGGAINFIMGP